MASIEFIQKRIAGKEKEISNLEKKIARIEAAKATSWVKNPYYYNESDFVYARNDLQTAQKALEQYRADLQAAQEKAASRNVPIILEFLNRWKQRVKEQYLEGFTNYIEAMSQYNKESDDLIQQINQFRYNSEEHKKLLEKHRNLRKSFLDRWNYIRPYVDIVFDSILQKNSYAFNTEKFQKELDQEADAKYDFLIERVNSIVGVITDATGLSIGDNGELNGFISGVRGTAKVTTIGAGGYNIQCFHFRTLVHEVH